MKNFLKGKIKNKFIAVVVTVILLIIVAQGYLSFSLMGVDRNSYVVLVNGTVMLNESELKEEKREQLKLGDVIETMGDDSIAVVEWGDGSLTRLGGGSKIQVHELDVEKDLSKINLSFTLEKGKTWSNVVSFLGEESYFRQNFDDIEASVRGTVFDVDLGGDYVFVQDHEVALQKGEQKVMVGENSAFSISGFSFIEIQKFLNEIRDKAWEDINMKLDGEYVEKLRAQVLEQFSGKNVQEAVLKNIDLKAESFEELETSIKNVSAEKKEELYNKLLGQYQKLNFVSADDSELFASKNELKKLLIQTASEEDKESLVKYSLYDLKDAIDSKNFDGIKESLNILGENKDILEKLDTDIFKDFQLLPDSIESLLDKSGAFKDIINFDIESINIDAISDKAKNLLDSSTNQATEGLNKLKGLGEGLLNNFGK